MTWAHWDYQLSSLQECLNICSTDTVPWDYYPKDAVDAYNLNGKVANSHRAIDDTLALYEVMKAMDEECDDLDRYINLFGYNPKYGVNGPQIRTVTYKPQPYNNYKKLYE